MPEKKVLGIIGVGPRGLYALENFVLEIRDLLKVDILLFEETGHFGNGQVYDINQPKTNWMNVSDRVLSLEMRETQQIDTIHLPSFPTYKDWIKEDYKEISPLKADYYPPRSKIGKYLHERFQAFVAPLIRAGIITLWTEKVVDIQLKDDGKLCIKSSESTFDNVDEVLLTIGHQPTEHGEQMLDWDRFSSAHCKTKLFKAPYPVQDFLNHPLLTEKSKIGIRGFGLSMVDVIRGIAEKYGDFITDDAYTRACHYTTSFDISDMLIPFSLDGLPLAPKPLNEKINEWFRPSANQLLTFETQIGNKKTQREAVNTLFLIEAFAPIAAKIYLGLPNAWMAEKLTLVEAEQVIKEYLLNQEFQHEALLSQKQSATKIMEDFVAMASGKEAVSLDYCIGQVWRFCQPSLYMHLSFNACSINVFSDIIALDESTKRYSYGPPVESIQQMLALVKSGIMNLEMLQNPTFKLSPTGWQFIGKNKTLTAEIMINSVLDPPKIEMVNSPIIENLLSCDLIEAVHDEHGVDTDENGYVKSKNVNTQIPIALLGRLARGTIIGVDAIAECFGTRPKNWAKQAALRLT